MNFEKIIDHPNPPHIGTIIYSALRQPQIDVNVTRAAKMLGVSRPTLSNLLNGNADLSEGMAFKIEQVFRIEAEPMLVYQAKRRYREWVRQNTI